MKEVSKEEFFNSFKNAERCTTGCPTSSHKVWEARVNGVLRARSIECDDGIERYYVMQGIY